MSGMKGHVRRRGSGWAWVADVGHQPAQRCGTCGRRTWVDRHPAERCRCGGMLGEPRNERRQKWSPIFERMKEAQGNLDEFKARSRSGGNPYPPTITFGAYAERWLETKRTKVRASTVTRYEGLLRDDVLPVVGSIRLTAIRRAHVRDVVDRARARGVSGQTVAHVARVLGSVLNAAIEDELIETNPAARVRVHVERPQLRWPTPAELDTLMATAEGGPWEIPMMLAATTGLRRSEVLGVRWQHVDLARGTIRVVQGVQRVPDGHGGSKLDFVEVKSQRSHRTIRVPARTIERLRRHRTEQLEQRLAAGARWIDLDLVCDNGTGGMVEPNHFSDGFKAIAKEAGLPSKVRLHDVRHGVATALLADGRVPMAVISALLGHSSTAFTGDTYAHVTEEMTGVAADALDRVLGGVRP
jgi:integrase